MTPQEGLAWFAKLSPSHIKMGLERVLAALARLGHPEREFPAIHVAGTNGKGSTCAILDSCLRQQYRVGLYTSPHLQKPNERIKIDGRDIDDETFGRRIVEVNDALGLNHELTYFEFGTVVMFHHFAREQIDVAVIETGLGGRLDATTACNAIATCITQIDFDHMEYLGDTLPKIAREKAGIFKPGVPRIVSSSFWAALPDGFDEGREPGKSGDARVEGRDFTRDDTNSLELHLKGPHQRENLALALETLKQVAAKFPLTDEQRTEGVRTARWPGRLEEFAGPPLVVLDGAHNPAGVRSLLTALDREYAGRTVHLVFGVFADKDSEPMIRALFPRVAAVHLAPIANPRSRDPKTYEVLARELNPNTTVHASAEEALADARAKAPGENGMVLVAGSLFLIGQLRSVLVR
ncbi:MAG: bifunctional folylpolyglutamate synthase/dihydrofolate synthase [Archangium sp.]|nr:bifunctional folylpolyglutamate synthase/dihydrofolate synthase [Archangium sp.]